MAMKWSWAFGNESRADLESIGFTFLENTSGSVVEGPVSSAVDPLNAYTYNGSPTRYGYEFDPSADGNTGRNLSMTLPAPALPNNKGIVTMAYRTGDAVFGFSRNLLVVGVDLSAGSFFFQSIAGTGTVSFYVDGQFKGTSAAMDASNWNYFAIVFDCSANPFTGSLYVNGVEEVTGSDARTGGPYRVDGISSNTTQSGTSYGTNIWGQFIVYDDPVADLADAVSPDNFVTRIVPNDNGPASVGAWKYIVASGTDGATSVFDDTQFSSASASFTSTIGPVGPVTGFTITVGATTVSVDSVSTDTNLVIGTGLGTNQSGLTYSVQNTNLFGAVSPPIDNTTYAGIASPSPGDRLEVETANGSSLQTLLGINPSSIKGATVHSVSLATAGTAKIGIQAAGSELLSPADPIQTSDTYTAQSFPNNPNGSTQATGTITTTAGVLAGIPPDTVTINGTALAAVSGARTPGSDDFSIDSGTDTGIRDDLLAAINDPLNSFTETVSGVATLTDQITLTATANFAGTAGNSITLAESTGGARISVSGANLSGGTDSAWVGADQPILVYEITTV